jgi:hypothetical protein
MPEIFVASSGRARGNPVTRNVRLDFESTDLDEITIQLPYDSLQALARQAREQIGPSPLQKAEPNANDDPLPLGEMYQVMSHSVGKTQDEVRLTITLESATGGRYVNLNLSPQEASLLADDLYEKAAP